MGADMAKASPTARQSVRHGDVRVERLAAQLRESAPPGEPGDQRRYVAHGLLAGSAHHSERELLAEARRLLGDEPGARNGRPPAEQNRRILATRASVVRPRPIQWLWRDRVPLGAVTLLTGRQGLGKSTLLAGCAADLSRGRLEGEAADVLLVSYEDHAETTIAPRLLAAGADLGRVHLLGASENGTPDLVSLPDDLELIAEHAQRIGARLLVIDPLVAALPAKIDAHRDQDVRRALVPLAQLAEAADLAIIAAIHLRKGGAAEALDRVSGSIAFTAAARSVLAFGADPADDEGPSRILAHAKSNVGRLARSLAFRLEGATVEAAGEHIETSRLVLMGECDTQARDVLSPSPPPDLTDTDLAADWLADELADGEWHPSREVKARAKQADHTERTLHRARVRLGIEDRREGFPAVSEWRLPVVPPLAGTGGATVGGTTDETRINSRDSTPATPQLCQVADPGTTEAEEAEREAAGLGLAAYDQEGR